MVGQFRQLIMNMLEKRKSLSEHFRQILVMVVGQAFEAGGYTLEHQPLQWSGGKFRFVKQVDESNQVAIVFQVLVYANNLWVSGQPSRFRVSLFRNNEAEKTLSELVVNDFSVPILPSAEHWWSFRDTHTLGQALAEAGHLVVGYGMPWLAGDLEPPKS